jgi:hypothetical protein
MVKAIDASGYLYMRVHDSANLFSPAYTRAWILICEALSCVRFWFPIRYWQAPWLDTIKELAALPNVAVRPSAIHFNDEPPRVDGLAAGTTASSSEYTCPAPRQHNSCGECRRCWVAKSWPISYHAHSYTAPRARLNARHERRQVAVIVSSRENRPVLNFGCPMPPRREAMVRLLSTTVQSGTLSEAAATLCMGLVDLAAVLGELQSSARLT